MKVDRPICHHCHNVMRWDGDGISGQGFGYYCFTLGCIHFNKKEVGDEETVEVEL